MSRGTTPEPGRWRSKPYQKPVLEAIGAPGVEQVLYLAASQGGGKALALDTPIPTPDGWRLMGELQVGELVFDELGRPTQIIAASEVMVGRPCFRLHFDDGSSLIADAEHRWAGYSRSTGPLTIRTTEQLSTGCRFRIPACGPLQLPAQELSIDPYVLGAWLGDGHSYSGQLAADVREELPQLLAGAGISVRLVSVKGNTGTYALGAERPPARKICGRGHALKAYRSRWQCPTCTNLYAKAARRGKKLEPPPKRPAETFHATLRELGVLANKHIPAMYLRASEAQRWALLQGLMDTDGYARADGKCEFTSTNEKLAAGVLELLCTLGFKPSMREGVAKLCGRAVGPKWRIAFKAYSDQPVFRMRRKQGRLRSRDDERSSPKEPGRRTVRKVERVASVPVRCIAVAAASHLYLAGRHFVPTHNTEILLNAIGYFIDVDPSPQIFVTYSVDMAKRVSKHRVAPMLRETEGLATKVKEARSRDSGNTILDKEYEGGQLTLVGANSAAGLAMYPKRVALFDEVDRYPPSAGTEGDPVSLAITRTSAFWNAVVLYATSPGTRQTSRAWRIWQQSDQQEWCLVCGDCGRAQVPKWAQVHWDKDEQGDAIEASAHYVCEACGSCWNDAQRWAASRRGRYVAGGAFSGIHAFRVSGLAVIGRTLKSVVSQWVRAQGNPEELKVFVNTVLSDWWDEDLAAKTIDETGLLPRREEMPESGARPVVPAGVAVMTAGVDVQDNRFEISVYGWGAGEESWLLRHEVIWGDPTTREGEVLAAAWQALDLWLNHPWARERGGADFIRAVCVDTGGHHTQAAYDFCSPRYRRTTPDGGQTFMFATKGVAGPGELWPRTPSKATRKVPLWPIHVDAGKGQIYSRLGIAEAGPGYVHFPKTVDAEFFKGLCSEKLVQGRDKRGFPTLTWKLKRDGLRNEPLDCAVLAYAALQGLIANGFDLEREVQQLDQRRVWEPPQVQPGAVASSTPPAPRRQPQGDIGWLGDTRDWLRR